MPQTFTEDPEPFKAVQWDGTLDGITPIATFTGQVPVMRAGVLVLMIDGEPHPMGPSWWVTRRHGGLCTHSPKVRERWRPGAA